MQIIAQKDGIGWIEFFFDGTADLSFRCPNEARQKTAADEWDETLMNGENEHDA